ncbi:hypothetical protein [uncultured Devosia sp.]|uniref:hypothetical protein n=1 Tax=uncultured Devosia sp. TaxID=211434 RepID=UPI002639B56A|nr:hypothetical protein [uncultured Devosia sp.]
MKQEPELLAKIIVDQHYAAGPEQLKAAIAEALAARDGEARPLEVSREQLLDEVAEQEQASTKGSE